MTNKELISKAELALNSHTVYATGGFGASIGNYSSQATRYYKNMYNNVYNADRKEGKSVAESKADAEKWGQKVLTAAKTKPCFAFDCVGLLKGLLWNWSAKADHVYGGADYESNGVEDWGAGTGGMIKHCTDVSSDFSTIVPGEMVWLDGHVGLYVGDGMVIECTTAWNDNVQKVECWNIKKTGRGRKWDKHGKLPSVTYEVEPVAVTATITGFKDEAEKKTFLNMLNKLTIK